MKAIFICRQGALAEGVGERCTLRCGAAAGLRLLADLDYRLIVIDESMLTQWALARSDGAPVRRPEAGRLPDNGRRRRRTDVAGATACIAPGREDDAACVSTSLLIYRLGDLLFREQLVLQGFYSCSHNAHLRANSSAEDISLRASKACFCKPPQPGLLLQAGFDHGIDLPASWMIGARLDDVEAGSRAGCRTVLIDNGIETSWKLGRKRVPTRIAPDLYEAAVLITREGQRK